MGLEGEGQRGEPGQLQSFRLSQLGWRRVHSLPRGPGGGGGGRVQKPAGALRDRQWDGVHQASQSRRACEMQIRESAVATAGGANRNPQGVQWGEREGESQDTAYTPTPTGTRGEQRQDSRGRPARPPPGQCLQAF